VERKRNALAALPGVYVSSFSWSSAAAAVLGHGEAEGLAAATSEGSTTCMNVWAWRRPSGSVTHTTCVQKEKRKTGRRLQNLVEMPSVPDYA